MNRLRFLFILRIMHCPTTRFPLLPRTYTHTQTDTHCALHSIHNTPKHTDCAGSWGTYMHRTLYDWHNVANRTASFAQYDDIVSQQRCAIVTRLNVVLLVYRFEYESCVKTTTNEIRISFCSFAFQLSNYIDTTISTSDDSNTFILRISVCAYLVRPQNQHNYKIHIRNVGQ